MGNPQPTGQKEIIAERRQRVWSFRVAGATVRQIKTLLEKQGTEVSIGTISTDLKAELKRVQKETLDDVKLHQAVMNARLEEIILGAYVKAKTGTKSAAEIVMMAMDRQIRIGVVPEAPKVIELNPKQVLAELLGMNEEDLPSELT
jgi:hypothetical protein